MATSDTADVANENQVNIKMEVEESPAAVKTEQEAEKPKALTEDEKEKAKRAKELEKYWRPVKANPMDFTGWTYLLQYVEQEDDAEPAREAYNAFFSYYPYCYGYWKKFADMEKRHNDLTRAVEVFEKGAKAIPLSTDLWLHYINFCIKEFVLLEDDIRKLFERAVIAAGTDFRSDKLWDAYLNWETDLKRVTTVYDRMTKIPLQLYSHHFDRFKKHILAHHPKEILDLDEFIKLRTEVVKEMDPGHQEDGDERPPGMDVPPGEEEGIGGKGDAEEAMKLREKIINIREVWFRQNEEEISKRWVFEEGIKRPYFHVKPLERSQLKNWRDYLDFEIQQGSHERVIVLFERCMIATALYEDFWLKYAKYLEEHILEERKKKAESNNEADIKKENSKLSEEQSLENTKLSEEQSLEAVRNVYKRACTIHLPKKPYIHMAWAAFEERHGKHTDAWQILSKLEEAVPGMVMVAMRRISLERRIGDQEKTEMLFQEYINKAGMKNVRAFYAIKYARYLFKVVGDEIKAKKVITDALEVDPVNEKLYIQLLDMEYQKQPVNVGSALEIFSKAISSEQVSVHTKIKMSQRRLEFLEDFGSSILQLKECYDEHQKLLKEMHSSEKKRKGTDTPVDEPHEKRTKNGAGDAQSDYNAYWAQYQNYPYPGGSWQGYSQQYYS